MNSKLCDGASSSNHEDRNANLNNEINVSKGAIPKTKNYLKNSQNGRKNVKLNNNFESVTSPNYDPASTNICKNGFSKTSGSPLIINGIHIEKAMNNWEHTEPKFEVSNTDIYLNNESDSSSSEDNDLSVSDDGCIYTYKADSIPDLPDILNNLDIPLFGDEPNEPRENTSSPEMDFLEMDFEPEPSVDTETEPPVTLPTEQASEIHLDENVLDYQQPCSSKDLDNPTLYENHKLDKENTDIELTQNIDKKTKKKAHPKKDRKEIKMPWSCTPEQRTKASKQLRIIRTDTSSGEESLASIVGHENMDEKKIMIWSHEEAYVKQITQIGPLSCSATAVLNVLIALRLPVPSIEVICNCGKLDANSELLTYLHSRSIEGQGHREIISGLHKATNGRIYARFFSMYPERCVNIYDWLGFWIQHGAIPIATLNLQKSQQPISESWCHQMIYGVDPDNVYLTNPIECVNSSVLWHQLVSESVLLIKREKIVNKFMSNNSLSELRAVGDPSYDELNVLGQVAKIIREDSRAKRENSHITSHLKIPTIFRSGVTLAIDRNSKAYPLLLESPELPLLNLNSCKQ
ncbi:uncharacterized protein LOC123308672 [Coccinella septempunctata]|uniref:uncharacterized protein LOC123308672 n=1 Tax=Coccinella septempunctata TaxID=41139 RepID=UPI001D067AC6|nr:uncharacterized protein LOC123308672 [Coccinella septempunctata]